MHRFTFRTCSPTVTCKAKNSVLSLCTGRLASMQRWYRWDHLHLLLPSQQVHGHLMSLTQRLCLCSVCWLEWKEIKTFLFYKCVVSCQTVPTLALTAVECLYSEGAYFTLVSLYTITFKEKNDGLESKMCICSMGANFQDFTAKYIRSCFMPGC